MNNQKHTLKEHYGLFIGGQWRDASDKAVYTSTNPANGEILAQCAQATKEDVDAAVAAAWKAFPEWKTQTKEARALILEKIADRIEELKKIKNGWHRWKRWTTENRSAKLPRSIFLIPSAISATTQV